MQTVLTTLCAPRRCRNRLSIFVATIGLMLPAFSFAVPVETLYDARVAVDPNDAESRDTAYERALQQVLVRITGSEDAAFSPELMELFPNPARFVLQYRPGADNSLWVSMDGAAIERVLKGSVFPVWGNDRPLTLIWIAVDWGNGERELLTAEAADANPFLRNSREQGLRERIEGVAQLRGVPVQLPPADDDVLADINTSDLWGGFHDQLLSVSRDLGASSVLVGRIRPQSPQRNRWSYYFGGQQRDWNGEIEEAVQLLADTLAGEFAFAGNARSESVLLTVSNVGNVEAYAAVQGLIGGLETIESWSIDVVSGDRIRYLVDVNGGAQRLAAILDFSGQLVRSNRSPLAAPIDGETIVRPRGNSLYYRYEQNP